MKITLFCVFVFWTICLTTFHQIPAQDLRDANIEKEVTELENLLNQIQHDSQERNEADEDIQRALHEGEEKRKTSKKEETDEVPIDEQVYAQEQSDEKDRERALQIEEERETIRNENIQRRQEKLSRLFHTFKHLDKPSNAYARKIEEEMQKFREMKKKLAERKKIRQWKKTNGDDREEDVEELPIDHPEKIDPDDPLSNLLEGMTIEQKGHLHLVQGLHPEDSAKTYGDSHDIHILTPEQQTELELNNMDNSGKRKRNFITDKSRLWKNGIVPYEIKDMSNNAVTVINKAIKQFHDNACVKWIKTSDPLYNPSTMGRHILRFINGGACSSHIGKIKTRWNYQGLSLSQPGCISVSTAVHEMLHALGAEHEQSRSDRDDYITIDTANVQKRWNGKKWIINPNMRKFSTQDNNPYDAESAMQYGLYAFSANGMKTIRFKDQRLEFLADTADGLEFYDIQDVTDAYNCTDHCDNNVPNCQNGGFVNFQCTCSCPDVLSGATCKQTVSNSKTCGGVINLATGEEKIITSPNFPSKYPTGLECTWLIKGTPNNIVRASVQYMDISADAACNHWLEFRYNLLGQKGPKRCGTNFVSDKEVWDSTRDELSNAMIIKFDSNTFSSKPAKTGFSIKVKSIGTGCVSNPCIYGKCDSPEDTSGYTCTCNQGVSGKNCDVLDTSLEVSCTFEYGEKCIFKNEDTDLLNWEYKNRGRGSRVTGPDYAHSGFQYIIMEAAGSVRHPGDTAVMSTSLALSATNRCMTFWYHMKGRDIGSLNIYYEGQSTSKTKIWTRSGAQGNSWIKGEVDIPAINNLTVVIEGVRGSGWKGDIGLDDISLTPGTCAVSLRCPNGWKLFSDKCYLFVYNKLTWWDAQAECQNEGGYLVEVKNERENAWLTSVLEDEVWLGLSNIQKEGRWRWVSDNSVVSYINWLPGEPNNERAEHCASYCKRICGRSSYGWNDRPCSYPTGYVCERHL